MINKMKLWNLVNIQTLLKVPERSEDTLRSVK